MLAGIGVSVAVIERSKYDKQRIGETLPPAARSLLCQIGVWDRFIVDSHLASPGNISIWGSDSPAENDFLFDPAGCGWHLDRVRFDKMLAEKSEANGAVVFTGATVNSYSQNSFGTWFVRAECDEEDMKFESDYLVFATGRIANIKLPLAGKRIYDRLVGVVTFLELKLPEGETDHRTLVESNPNGWWYSSVLPEGKLVLAFMTDGDLLPKNFNTSSGIREQLLHNAPHTNERVATSTWSQNSRTFAANSYFHRRSSGRNWMAIGDLAFTFDPLSSTGIVKAIQSGIDAADAIAQLLQGDDVLLREYTGNTAVTFSRYLKDLQGYYNVEKRWPNSPFWRRRRSMSLIN